MLLLESLQQIAYYTLMKLEGESVQKQPEVLDELITTRLMLEKLRPLDAKLQYQIEKMCKTAMAQNSSDQLLQHKPRPELFEKELTTDAQIKKLENPSTDSKPEVYRPAKLNPVHFEVQILLHLRIGQRSKES